MPLNRVHKSRAVSISRYLNSSCVLIKCLQGTLCKYATASVDTHRRNCDLAGTPDAEKKQNSDWVPGYCKNVHTVWKSVPAPVLGLPTRRPEDWFSTECYVPTVLRILFSREHYRTSTSRFSTVHYIPTVLRSASRFSTVHYIPTVLGFPPQWMY